MNLKNRSKGKLRILNARINTNVKNTGNVRSIAIYLKVKKSVSVRPATLLHAEFHFLCRALKKVLLG